ncbi:protein phosphatase 2C domain-containing protein, partial [Streptomyces sparsus]
AAPCADRAARDACHWIAGAVGRSHARLSEDIRAGRRGALKSGLGRLTARSMGRLRSRAAELGLEPAEYTAELRCLLLPVDPRCRTRVFFGVGGGGLFRLRDGAWQDLEPGPGEPQTDEEADRSPESAAGVQPDGRPATGLPAQQTRSAAVSPQADPDGRDGRGREGQARNGQDGNGRGGERRDGVGQSFQEEPGGLEAQSGAAGEALTTSGAVFRFRASQARPGDVLLLCGRGFAEPLREEQPLADHLATRWTTDQPPGLADFLVDVQTRLKGYADDRTAAAVWES